MRTKNVNLTISTLKSTDDYSAIDYEVKGGNCYIYKNGTKIIYPMCNVVRIVVRDA